MTSKTGESESLQAPPREQWSGQLGFLIAAIGSAIGLGNIWRFPGVAYTNGGGAFIVPYVIALLAAGLPPWGTVSAAPRRRPSDACPPGSSGWDGSRSSSASSS